MISDKHNDVARIEQLCTSMYKSKASMFILILEYKRLNPEDPEVKDLSAQFERSIVSHASV